MFVLNLPETQKTVKREDEDINIDLSGTSPEGWGRMWKDHIQFQAFVMTASKLLTLSRESIN